MSLEPSKVIKSGSLDSGTSNHKLVYSVINLQKPVKKPRIRMVKELQNYEHIDGFKTTLEDTPWWVTNIFDDVDDVANA